MTDPAPVLPLDPRKRRRKAKRTLGEKCPCPERLSPGELEDVLTWGMTHGYALEELEYGWQRVKNWARGSGAMRVDWVRVLWNAMLGGWGRAGYGNWLARRKRPPRTITPELIERLVAERREEFGP
jgi:hypothetical protein